MREECGRSRPAEQVAVVVLALTPGACRWSRTCSVPWSVRGCPPAERKVETMRIGALFAMLAVTALPISHVALAADESRPVMSGTNGTGAPASGATLREFLATAPGAAMRHSGTVVGIAPDRSSITISETVAWRGPGTGVVERTIAVADATQVHLVM